MEDETPLGLEYDGYNSEDFADADTNTCLGDEDCYGEDDEDDEPEYDGQPDWQQEWEDFGECTGFEGYEGNML